MKKHSIKIHMGAGKFTLTAGHQMFDLNTMTEKERNTVIVETVAFYRENVLGK